MSPSRHSSCCLKITDDPRGRGFRGFRCGHSTGEAAVLQTAESVRPQIAEAARATPALTKREQCPSCGSRGARVLLSVPYQASAVEAFIKTHYHRPPDTTPLEGSTYEVVRCESCSLGYQRYVPGPELLQTIYDEWISSTPKEHVRSRYGLEDYRLLAQEVQFVIEHFRKPPGSIHVLDFGWAGVCGLAWHWRSAAAWRARSCPSRGSSTHARSGSKCCSGTSCPAAISTSSIPSKSSSISSSLRRRCGTWRRR